MCSNKIGKFNIIRKLENLKVKNLGILIRKPNIKGKLEILN